MIASPTPTALRNLIFFSDDYAREFNVLFTMLRNLNYYICAEK